MAHFSNNQEPTAKWYKHRFINWSIKLLVISLLTWSVYRYIFGKENATAIWEAFLACFTWEYAHWLIITIFLIPINWGLEALKWQQLIKGFSDYSFWRIFKAILVGIAIGLFTPNRIGEYGGRILMVKPEHNWKAFIATAVGGFSQLLVLLSFGLLGLIYFASIYFTWDTYLLYLIFFLGLGLISLMLFCFFNIDLLLPIARRLPFVHYLKQYLKHLMLLTEYNAKALWTTLLFSALRLFTYSSQYYFMLRFFDIEIPSFLVAISGIFTHYFFQTSIPLPPIFDVAARGPMALFIWQRFTSDTIGILGSTYTLYIINLIIPAILGGFFLLRVNIIKSLGYQIVNPKDK